MRNEPSVSPFGPAWWLLTGELFEILAAATGALWVTIFRSSCCVAVPAAMVLFVLAVLAKVRGESLEAEARRLARLDPGPPGKD